MHIDSKLRRFNYKKKKRLSVGKRSLFTPLTIIRKSSIVVIVKIIVLIENRNLSFHSFSSCINNVPQNNLPSESSVKSIEFIGKNSK